MIKLTPAKCPQCGADIEVNPELEKTICQYCGTTILVQDAIQKIELSGTVKVAGIKNRDDFLDQAKKHFKVGEYIEAKNCLYEIIKEDSFDIETYCELCKNDLKLMQTENFNINITFGNNNYNKVANEYYEEFNETYERILKIDENNERDKYFGELKSDVDKLLEDKKKVDERLEKNNEIVKRLNEDWEKVKECTDFYNYQIFEEKNVLAEYRKLISETFHTTDFVDATFYAKVSGDSKDRYLLDSFSRITQDGIIYMNYEKSTSNSSSNSYNQELFWRNQSVPVENYEEIDQRFNEYCSKIDPIIEECRKTRYKLDSKYEKSRKRKYRKYLLSFILCWIFIIALIIINIIVFIEEGIRGLLIVIFFVDSWVVSYIMNPWYENAHSGLVKYKKLIEESKKRREKFNSEK